jgi:uncharacterized protein YndB with AHSA1/START domain
MEKPKFVYVTYIRTTPEKLWAALTEPEFTRQYWTNSWQDCAWKKGASWKLMIPDGRVADSGEVLEIDPPRKLVLSWKNQFKPQLKDAAGSRLTYQLEPQDDLVKLTLVHESDTSDDKLISMVSKGWPMVLASLKTLLETGESFLSMRQWPSDDGKCVSDR